MSEQQATLEQPQAPQTPEPTPVLSVKDHAATYSDRASGRPSESAQPAEPQDAKDDLAPIRPVDQQRREQGKFAEGKQRIRGKDAVERINTLTARAKTAEERFEDALGRLARAEAELATLRRQGASPQRLDKAEQRVERAEAKFTDRIDAMHQAAPRFSDPIDPEPQETDPAFAGDYGKYLQSHARWAARDEYRQIRAGEAQATKAAQTKQAAQTALMTWGGRIDAAKQTYPDYHEVALATPAPWDEGSVIDAFIMEDDNGGHVLYYLRHPDHAEEVGDLLREPPLKQLTRLALLSQRFSPTPSRQAGATGAAAGRQPVVLPHRPPTPVRTEAQRTSSGPPTDGTLSVMGHAKAFRRS